MKPTTLKVSSDSIMVLYVVTISLGVLIYEVMDDELLEDDDLVIPGETSLDDSTATESDSSQDDLPVRLLQDFTIYDMSTNEAVPIGELMSLKYVDKSFGASGLVIPWIDNDIDEEDDDDADSDDNVACSNLSERVKLSKLLEFDVHHYSEVSKSLDRFVDPYPYLHTSQKTS
jgi:DNA (cytosine-5)-methyltransferase 1